MTEGNSPRKFAVFDIDGTIIRWQLYHAIVHELAKAGAMGRDADARIKQARMTWKERHHHDSFHEYEQVLIDAYRTARTQIKVSDFEAAIDTVFETYRDQVYTYTRDLIKRLKHEGYLLFAVSGSQQKIIEKLGNYYGFDEVVGSVHGQTDDGMMSETESSPVLTGKAPALQALIDKYDATLEGSYAIGDSLSDAAMLEMVEHPIAFNPDDNLYRRAREAGWDIVIERKNVSYHLKSTDGTYVLAETD
jgi:HAD superfamily hydrolase (TIGR01490 family)